MSRVEFGLGMNLSVWLRRMFQARSTRDRLRILRRLRPSDIRLYVPEVKNRVTGRSMGEHTEDMAKDWKITRQEEDELALESHRRAVAAQDRGFFDDLIVPLDGVTKDHFPRRDTSLEKLAKLKPVFDRTSGRGTITAGNSSPLTDGAAGLWVATDEGLTRLPATMPRVRLVDFEMAAIDIFHEGLLMAPVDRHSAAVGAARAHIRRHCAVGNPRGVLGASGLPHQGATGQRLRPRQGRHREYVRPLSGRADEPERRQRRARSSVCGHRCAYFESGGQGTCRDGAGQPRHRQHLRRRRTWHRGAAGALSISCSRDGVKERTGDVTAPPTGGAERAAFTVGELGKGVVTAGRG